MLQYLFNEITLNPLNQWCFVSSLIDTGPMVLEKKTEIWNIYKENDASRSENLNWNLSAKVW